MGGQAPSEADRKVKPRRGSLSAITSPVLWPAGHPRHFRFPRTWPSGFPPHPAVIPGTLGGRETLSGCEDLGPAPGPAPARAEAETPAGHPRRPVQWLRESKTLPSAVSSSTVRLFVPALLSSRRSSPLKALAPRLPATPRRATSEKAPRSCWRPAGARRPVRIREALAPRLWSGRPRVRFPSARPRLEAGSASLRSARAWRPRRWGRGGRKPSRGTSARRRQVALCDGSLLPPSPSAAPLGLT